MTQEQAKQKLFEELDKAFRKYGADAGMANPGFFPHYSEVGAETMRPTWYTKFQIDEGTTLITMYETVRDICISTLVKSGEGTESMMHTGYPKNMEDAKKIVELFKHPK